MYLILIVSTITFRQLCFPNKRSFLHNSYRYRSCGISILLSNIVGTRQPTFLVSFSVIHIILICLLNSIFLTPTQQAYIFFSYITKRLKNSIYAYNGACRAMYAVMESLEQAAELIKSFIRNIRNLN